MAVSTLIARTARSSRRAMLDEVRNIAHPDAGEMRLLNSIVAMPIAEMGRALRQARG